MIVATPRFFYSSVQITSEIWVGTRSEWDGDTRSHEAGWNVLSQGSTIVANRLAIPAAILLPAPSPVDAPADATPTGLRVNGTSGGI